MKEGQFNLNLTKAISAAGCFCKKISDRFHAGYPDIYVAGGIWIESKVLKIGKMNTKRNVWDMLTPEQKNFMEEAVGYNDYGIVAVRIEGPSSKHLMFIPYTALKLNPIMTNAQLEQQPKIVSEKNYPVEHIFGDQFIDNDPSMFNFHWYKECLEYGGIPL